MIGCTFEDGNQAFLRHTVVDSIVVKDGQILLVKRTAKLLEGGKWALPGGFVGQGETVFQAAARETLEETGWSVKDPYPLIINSSPTRPKEDRQNISFVFVFTAGRETGQHDWENDEVKWFPLTALPPEKDMAFDHIDYINLYLESQATPFALPRLI